MTETNPKKKKCKKAKCLSEETLQIAEEKGNKKQGRKAQFSSVTQSCPALCDPMNHSTSGLPVHHQLLESTQAYVHWVGDAIQPSHPLSSPSSPALNLSQHQGLFKWVSSLHQVAKILKFQLQNQSFQWTPRTGKEGYQIEYRVPENSKERYEGLIKWTVQRSRGNNTMGRTPDLIKKIRDIKGTFHVRMGTIRSGKVKDLKDAEEIKKRWQNTQKEYTEYTKKVLMTWTTNMMWSLT